MYTKLNVVLTLIDIFSVVCFH